MHTIHLYMVQQLLAKNIKKYRKKAGLTQRCLAERCGVSASFIAHIETKSCNASIGFLEKICTILDIHPSQLFE